MWSTKWPYHFWVSTDTSEPTPELIDSFISAKIPDPAVDPLRICFGRRTYVSWTMWNIQSEFTMHERWEVFEKLSERISCGNHR
jgi:hypothetical protein